MSVPLDMLVCLCVCVCVYLESSLMCVNQNVKVFFSQKAIILTGLCVCVTVNFVNVEKEASGKFARLNQLTNGEGGRKLTAANVFLFLLPLHYVIIFISMCLPLVIIKSWTRATWWKSGLCSCLTATIGSSLSVTLKWMEH